MGSDDLLAASAGLQSAINTAYNQKMSRQVFDWQKAQWEETKSREDNAVQRRVADLKAAGLSPVLAAGSAASAASPIHLNAPTMEGNAIGTAIDVLQGKRNIAQTNAQIKAVEAQAEKAREEAISARVDAGIKRREADILEQMDRLQSDDGSLKTGRTGEALMRLQDRNNQSLAVAANLSALQAQASGANYDLGKSQARGVRTNSSINDIADLYDFVQNGSGQKALLLDLLMSISGGVIKSMPGMVKPGR